MPIRLDSRAADFAARFGDFLAAKREAAADVEDAVRGIIDAVKARGDAALVEFTNKFDRADLEALGEAAASRNRWEFMLTVNPLALPNATGSPANPIATF